MYFDSLDFDLNIWFWARNVSKTFKKRTCIFRGVVFPCGEGRKMAAWAAIPKHDFSNWISQWASRPLPMWSSLLSVLCVCRSVIICTSIRKGTGIVNLKYIIFFYLLQVHPRTSVEDQDELSSLLQVPLMVCTSDRSACICFGPCKRIWVPRDFCWWNPESGKFLLVEYDVLGFGIRNPEFHEQ